MGDLERRINVTVDGYDVCKEIGNKTAVELFSLHNDEGIEEFEVIVRPAEQ